MGLLDILRKEPKWPRTVAEFEAEITRRRRYRAELQTEERELAHVHVVRSFSSSTIKNNGRLDTVRAELATTESILGELERDLVTARTQEANTAHNKAWDGAEAAGEEFREALGDVDKDLAALAEHSKVALQKMLAFVQAVQDLIADGWDSTGFRLNDSIGHALSVQSEGRIGSVVAPLAWMQFRDDGSGSVAQIGGSWAGFALRQRIRATRAVAGKEDDAMEESANAK